MKCYLEGCAKDCADGKISPMSFFKMSRYVQNICNMSKICPKENDLNNQIFIIS